jgi:hypothetical protein
MQRKPYKFLDAFEKDDHEIFFGRSKEVEEIHSRLFHSDLLVLYGPSGTGKTSILKCGLSNRIPASDWKPLFIRRNFHIIESIENEIQKLAKTPLEKAGEITAKLQSLYLDYLTPVYLVFDQLEELFIFGDKQEKFDFATLITTLLKKSEHNLKIIFVIREEYLADLSIFEEELPEIFDNRYRVERMGRSNMLDAIKKPAGICNVKLDDGLAEAALEKLTDEKGNAELTYVQVLMDNLYKTAEARDPQQVHLKTADLEKLGHIGNLMSKFLDEQLLNMENARMGEDVLKTMISLDGTKKPMRIADIESNMKQLNKKISNEQLLEIVQYFVNVRIFSEKDENGFYELRHDSLAARIYERMTLVEKELLEVQQFIGQAFLNYERRNLLLRKEDLEYILPYEGRLHLERPVKEFIETSRKSFEKARKRRRRVLIASMIALLAFFSGLTIWALLERGQAENQKLSALQALQRAEEAENAAWQEQQIAEEQRQVAEQEKARAENAYQIAIDQVYENMIASLAISANNMNVLYRGIWNPVSITVSGLPPETIEPFILLGKAEIKGRAGNYEFLPASGNALRIGVKGSLTGEEEMDFGYKEFRVFDLPVPTASVAGITGGRISLDELKNDPIIRAYSPAENYFIGLTYKVISISTTAVIGKGDYLINRKYHSNEIGDDFISAVEKDRAKGETNTTRVWIEDIVAELSIDGSRHGLGTIVLEVTSPDFDPEKEKIKENINKLLFAAQEERRTDPYKAYRYAEAALLISEFRADLAEKIVENYIETFSCLIERYGLINSSNYIYFNHRLSRIVEINKNGEINFYKVNSDSIVLLETVKLENYFSHYDLRFIEDKIVLSWQESQLNRAFIRSRGNSSISIFYDSGKIINNISLKQLAKTLIPSYYGEYFISLPEHYDSWFDKSYDSRASLWSIEDGFINYLWGNKKTPPFRTLLDGKFTVFLGFQYVDFASFGNNNIIILGYDRYNKKFYLYNASGTIMKTIDAKINPRIGAIDHGDNVIYWGYKSDESYGSVYTRNIFSHEDSEMIFDSVSQFMPSLCGDYFILSKVNNKSNLQMSHLYNSSLNLISTYPNLMFKSFQPNTAENKLYLWCGNQDQPRHIILPITDIPESIIRFVNKQKLYGNVSMLETDDLEKYGIPGSVLWEVQDRIEEVIAKE